jgi:tetratricopeptide (TPR) repeat protein
MPRIDDRPPGDPAPAARADRPPADPRAVAEASDLLKQGVNAYQLGEYDQAEQLLKRSITVYPFLAQANLALGKIFLMRGAAAKDEALIDSARLMFDMAHSIDPTLREPLVLLELFKPRS